MVAHCFSTQRRRQAACATQRRGAIFVAKEIGYANFGD